MHDKLSIFDFTSPEMVEEFINEAYHQIEGEAHFGDIQSWEVLEYFEHIVSQALDEKQRKILKLHLDGYPQKEISEILSMSQSSISRNIQKSIDLIVQQAQIEEADL